MSSLPIKRLTATTALVAMVVLQVSGAGIRYLCDCTGEVVFTVDEHCHGEHGELGPGDHEPAGHRHHDDDHQDAPADCDSHRHHLAVDTSEPGKTPALVSAPPLRLLPTFWVELPEGLSIPSDHFVETSRPPRDDGGPPPTSLLVTRSVVRLI